ncbi:MAG: metallophosphoesterase [Thermoguttaceae bacterium]|jgi:3',5'-cyclic AMP phosphodiesterase CpdA
MPIYLPPISRRSFLTSSLAAGAGVLLDRKLFAAERKTDPHRWVLISDTHIGAHREDTNNGVKPAETFTNAVGQVLNLDPRPAGIIITGDQAFLKGLPDNYKLIKELYQPIREAGISLHLVLGNHDQRENFWAAFPEAKPARTAADRQAAVVETPLANWFLMDSLYQTELTPGLLGKDQLQWLAKSLDAHADKPALLVAHHNLDGVTGLHDAAALLQIAVNHQQAKAYFHGHTHQWKVRREKEIHIVNVPATAWLFDAKEPRGWLDISLQKAGATVVMNALDKKHVKHGERHELKWRA